MKLEKLQYLVYFVCLAVPIGLLIHVHDRFKPTCQISKQQIDLVRINSVRSLVESGLYSEAKSELVDAIKKNNLDLNKQKVKIPSNFCYLLDSSFDPQLGWLDREINTWEIPLIRSDLSSIGQLLSLWNFILNVLVGLAAFFVIIQALIWIDTNTSGKNIRLDIKDINDELISLKIGKGTTATIKDLILRSNELGTNPELSIALEPIEKFESPIEIKELATLLKFMSWLFKPTSFTLTGYFQQSDRGVSLILVLTSSDGLTSIQTFYQKDYDPNLTIVKEVIDLYPLISIPASIWILSKLNLKSFKKWLSFCGCNERESYTYSQVGLHWYNKHEYPESRKMLHKSLMYNSSNRFALLTLGAIEIANAVEKKDEKSLDEAIKILDKAIRVSESKGKDNYLTSWKSFKFILVGDWLRFVFLYRDYFVRPHLFNHQAQYPTSPVWYKAMFQLLVAKQYAKHLFLAQCDEHNSDSAENLGKYLIKAVEQGQKNPHTEAQKILSQFLSIFEVSARIMYAEILVDLVDRATEQIEKIELKYQVPLVDDRGNFVFETDRDNDRKKPIHNHEDYYNLACYYALHLKKCDDDRTKEYTDIEAKMFGYLKYALKQDRTLFKLAVKDPCFKYIKEDNELAVSFSRIINLARQQKL
jgi:tetratricopeptide (TPR) repeat protein